MSLQIKKESGVVYDPVFLLILEDIPGGVTVKTNRFPTTTKEIKKGALLNAMTGASIGLYNVIKTVKLTASKSSLVTIMQIEPIDHLFVAGNYIHIYSATAGTIARVSTTAIALKTAQRHKSSLPTGTILYETATIATATARYAANAVLRDTIEVRRGGVSTLLDNIFAGAVVRGTVDESEIPYFVTAADKISLTDRIRFA